MTKPFVFAHMLTSLDGKITGEFFNSKETKQAQDLFYNLAFGGGYYPNDGWLSGRVTSDDNFTHYKQVDLSNLHKYEGGDDHIMDLIGDKYYISIDPKGVLAWENNTFKYKDTTAMVLEVVTNQADKRYLQYLRELNIPYIICGEDELDYELLLTKLYDKFKLRNIMLGGGAYLNWSFISRGLCDEVSTVMSPTATGDNSTSLYTNPIDNSHVDFKLLEVKSFDNIIWTRYQPTNIQ